MKHRQTRLALGVITLLFVILTGCSGGSGEEPSVKATEEVRSVSTEKGNIEIPNNPKRIVGLSVVYPDFLHALGVTPVAVQNYHDEFSAYLKESFKNTVNMGISQTPDFEKILAADPDLIIAPVWWSDKDYEQLSQIAPTVLLPQRDDWRDELKDIAQILNKQDVAQKVIDDLEKQELDAKKRLDELVGDETVMYMMIMPKEIFVYGENIDRGSFIHNTLGLTPVPNFPSTENSMAISLEALPEYNPDHIIVQLDDENNKTIQQYYNDITSSTLWKNMKAVKNNNVYMMGGKEWFSLGMSPLANSYAINEVVQAFENKKK